MYTTYVFPFFSWEHVACIRMFFCVIWCVRARLFLAAAQGVIQVDDSLYFVKAVSSYYFWPPPRA